MKLTARFGDPLYSANGLFRIAQFQGTGSARASRAGRAGRAGDLRPGPATRYPAG
jgi:hypothetical protein